MPSAAITFSPTFEPCNLTLKVLESTAHHQHSAFKNSFKAAAAPTSETAASHPKSQDQAAWQSTSSGAAVPPSPLPAAVKVLLEPAVLLGLLTSRLTALSAQALLPTAVPAAAALKAVQSKLTLAPAASDSSAEEDLSLEKFLITESGSKPLSKDRPANTSSTSSPVQCFLYDNPLYKSVPRSGSRSKAALPKRHSRSTKAAPFRDYEGDGLDALQSRSASLGC